MEGNKKMTNTVIFVVVFCLISGVLLFFGNNDVVLKSTLKNLNLLPIPETFTELYFEDFSVLPKESVAGQAMNFKFTVHNKEGVDKDYPYKVYFVSTDRNEIVFKRGTLKIVNNDYKSVDVNYIFKDSNLKGKVIVELLDLKQQIDFILPNYN